jgi:hypothetical protein
MRIALAAIRNMAGLGTSSPRRGRRLVKISDLGSADLVLT